MIWYYSPKAWFPSKIFSDLLHNRFSKEVAHYKTDVLGHHLKLIKPFDLFDIAPLLAAESWLVGSDVILGALFFHLIWNSF